MFLTDFFLIEDKVKSKLYYKCIVNGLCIIYKYYNEYVDVLDVSPENFFSKIDLPVKELDCEYVLCLKENTKGPYDQFKEIKCLSFNSDYDMPKNMCIWDNS